MKISKETKKKIINYIINKIEDSRISTKLIRLHVRALHLYLPIIFIIIILFGPGYFFILGIILQIIVTILFFIFDGCLLTMLENRLYNDGINPSDLFLELLYLKPNSSNRMYISIGGFIIWMLIIFIKLFSVFI